MTSALTLNNTYALETPSQPSMQQIEQLTNFLQLAFAENTNGNPIAALWAAKKGILLATELQDNNSLVLLYLGEALAYCALGKNTEAMESFHRGIELEPHDNLKAIFYKELATLHRMNNNPQDALAAAYEGLEQNPTDKNVQAGLYLEIAMIQYEAGKDAPAFVAVDEGLKLSTIDIRLKFHLLFLQALLHRKMNDSGKVLEVIKQTKGLEITAKKLPHLSKFYLLKAWAHNKENKPAKALHATEIGIAFAPITADIRNQLNVQRELAIEKMQKQKS